MLSKLLNHIKSILGDYNIKEYHAWSDSTTVLHWISGKGSWKQFVQNRVNAINTYDFIQWHYVPTDQNPSDIGGRGTYADNLQPIWFHGPKWIGVEELWPEQPQNTDTDDALKESKLKKAIQLQLTEGKDTDIQMLEMLHKYNYQKSIRIMAYVTRFINNCQLKKKRKGSLLPEEIMKGELLLIRAVQQSTTETPNNIELIKREDGILVISGRIPDYHPIYISDKQKLATLIIEHFHQKSLHSGVSVTMANIHERFWIPKLRSLVKSCIHKCHTCKRYRVKPIGQQPPSKLPRIRTELVNPFTVTGVDFAGPIIYKINKRVMGKSYISLFTCTTTRAVHLKLCKDLTVEEFKQALKEFVARRGKPQMLVSDNGKTFVSTSKWIATLKNNEDLMNYIGNCNIIWKFNMSRAPWWGGFFERLIGIMKQSLSKTVGKGLLSYGELEEVLLDIECMMNNRPLLYYKGDEFDKPVLTPNTLINGEVKLLLEEDLENLPENTNITKRLQYIQQCKYQLRKRWIKEYLHALEEGKSHQST